jgi:hypothetical protein
MLEAARDGGFDVPVPEAPDKDGRAETPDVRAKRLIADRWKLWTVVWLVGRPLAPISFQPPWWLPHFKQCEDFLQ